jgi:hypothetical protein
MVKEAAVVSHPFKFKLVDELEFQCLEPLHFELIDCKHLHPKIHFGFDAENRVKHWPLVDSSQNEVPSVLL